MDDFDAILNSWSEEAKEAATLVIDKYGEPDEATDSMLIWNQRGPWTKTIAYRDPVMHNFPAPHKDSIEQFLDYQVPVGKFDDIAAFDGSVVVNRTTGQVSARCHDEEANSLALNLVNDIVTGEKNVQDARNYYAREFLAYRKREATPYMKGIRFQPQPGANDPDKPVLSDQDIQKAKEEGTTSTLEIYGLL